MPDFFYKFHSLWSWAHMHVLSLTSTPTGMNRCRNAFKHLFAYPYLCLLHHSLEMSLTTIHILFRVLPLFRKRRYSDISVYVANESEYSTNILIYMKPCKIRFFHSLPVVVDLLDRANTASLFHSFNQLIEKVGAAMCVHIPKPVDIQVFDDI